MYNDMWLILWLTGIYTIVYLALIVYIRNQQIVIRRLQRFIRGNYKGQL